MVERTTALVTPDEYLKAELESPVKHELVGGAVYAMAGAKNQHNDIALNLLAGLHARLRGKPCRPYDSDTKVRIRLPNETRFYYPDAQVTCKPNPPEDTFQDHPVLVAEVLSDGTRRTDAVEKREAYLSIASLDVYLLVESEAARIVAFERTDAGFVRRVYEGAGVVLSLKPLGIDLPLAELYEGIALDPQR